MTVIFLIFSPAGHVGRRQRLRIEVALGCSLYLWQELLASFPGKVSERESARERIKGTPVDTIPWAGLIPAFALPSAWQALSPINCIIASSLPYKWGHFWHDVTCPAPCGSHHDTCPALFSCPAFIYHLSFYIFTCHILWEDFPNLRMVHSLMWACKIILYCNCLLVFCPSPTFYDVSSQGQDFCLVHCCIPGSRFHYCSFTDEKTKARGMKRLAKSHVSARDIIRRHSAHSVVCWLFN